MSIAIAAMLSFSAGACGRSGEAEAALVERGRALYEANCRVCHGDAATGAGAVPPAPSHGPEGHTWHHADGQLVDIVLGRFDYPGRAMPSFQGVLTEEDAEAVLAYLKTSWLPEQRAFQEEASRSWEEANLRAR